MTASPSYRPGSKVLVFDRPAEIKRLVDVSKLLVRFDDDGSVATVPVAEIMAASDGKRPRARAVDAVGETELVEARRRLAIIKPLLEMDRGRTERAAAIAAENGTHLSTIYRWIRTYEDRRLLSDLAPARSQPRKRRLSPEVEAIINDAIEQLYLTRQRLPQSRVASTILGRCKAAGLKPPNVNSILKRIGEIDPREAVRRRHGEKAARDKLDPVTGTFPSGEYPLQTLQIDHTLLDIMLVDDETRQPIGRPFLTLAIDVFSRMVAGYYLTLEAPSAFSVTMCLAQALLPKELELAELGIPEEWPVWGRMRGTTIHADNGKEFHSQAVRRVCEQYDLNIEWRPVKRPEFGGHIERLMGTVAGEIHALPGTTFSSVADRGDYKSTAKAVMTFPELRKWLLNFIAGVYHQRIHRALKTRPVDRWRDGVLGTEKSKGTGLPEPVADVERLLIDLLPSTERTIQREGIAWDNVWYTADVLRPFIHARRSAAQRKFVVRRDPRDISRIYLLDPKSGNHLVIPYRDIAKPSISLWELRAAHRNLVEQGRKDLTEDAIFAARERMVRIADEAKTETLKARRARQRRKIDAAARPPKTKAAAGDVKKGITLIVDNSKPARGKKPSAAPAADADRFEFTEDELAPTWEDWQ
jgi:putative transposase